MRKTHCACLLLGIMLGLPLGFGLVVLQMKYGRGPVVAVDTSPEALKETVLHEPKPDGQLLDDGWATGGDDGTSIAAEAVGPVEVTVVQETPKPEAGSSLLAQGDEASRRESCERRMMQHLLQHARSAAQGEEAQETTPAGELAQPEVPEPLPMPACEPEAASATPADRRFDFPIAYPKGLLNVTPPPAVPVAEDFESVVRRLPVSARTFCTGAYAASLRTDGQLKLPAEVCDQLLGGLPDTLYLVPLRHQVRLYTPRGLKQLLQALQESGYWNQAGPHEQAVLFSCIRRVEVGGDGKFYLPAGLAKFGGLKDRIALVGVQDHFEIWDADAWRETVTAVLPDAAALALPADEASEAVPEVQDE
ncbi:MAG: hypothetical protein JNM56_21510 [Planctomycetia bacterium]|nr:hypothetical protein [Planctomycetia bacterium]